jgi:acyl-CoA thioesterase I
MPSTELQRFLARYVHPEKLPALQLSALPSVATASLAAPMLGCQPSDYADILKTLDALADQAVDRLLEHPNIRRCGDSLPAAAGERILALGDSITDDHWS